jgi:hypothetical protein
LYRNYKKGKLKKIIHMLSPGSPSATIGELEGEIDLQWDSVKGAKCYVIELSNSKNTGWKQLDIVSVSRHTATDLKSKILYSFRIAAVYGNQQGPWSNIVSKKL